jgi:hypothetical protein
VRRLVSEHAPAQTGAMWVLSRARPGRRADGRKPAVTATTDPRATAAADDGAAPTPIVARRWVRWLPLAATLAYLAGVLLSADTAPLDLLRYAAYVVLALLLPGTLVYRSLRRTPHSLVDDLAMGLAVGLALELPAWALASVLDLRGLLWLWPLAVVAPFAVAPGLRRHWRVSGYTPAPLGWSWTVSGVVAFFTTYLSSVFLHRNPILPTGEGTRQYLDLAYQLSLAGEAKHQFPLHVPQVAGEPLEYHWFGHAHMASTSLIGGIDLPVVALRLAIPGLAALAILLTAVVGWRITGKPFVGAVAAVLFFVVGEVNFTDPVTFPFGTQVTFAVWHGMSMIYSWVLLLALIAVLARIVSSSPAWRDYVLAALLILASCGAKASSLPVVGVALLVTAVALLIAERRIPGPIVVAGLLTAAAQLAATAVLFRFNSYGLTVEPFFSIERFTAAVPALLVVVAFVINLQLRAAGIVPLVWIRRGRLNAVQWFLLGGAVAGPLIYLALLSPSDSNQYFTRAGFSFAVLLSAWGYVLVFERARLSRVATEALVLGSAAFVVLLVGLQFVFADPTPADDPLAPLLRWTLLLASVGLLSAAIWGVASLLWGAAVRGRGGIVALTAVLLVGAPGLVMDMRKSERSPNGGAYATVALPLSRVDAARWVRDHSAPGDVVATNVHCLATGPNDYCDPRSFWLSAYAERRVLVEGWAFAPRVTDSGDWAFWDPDLLRRNDAAFTAPTRAGLAFLRDHGVKWLVVDQRVGQESPELASLATRRYHNGRLAVYEL